MTPPQVTLTVASHLEPPLKTFLKIGYAPCAELVKKTLPLKNKLLGKLINDNSRRHGDIHGMLRSQLRNFQTPITGVHHILVDAFYFVTHHDSILPAALRLKLLQLGRVFYLLDGKHLITLTFQVGNGIGGIVVITPLHAVLGTKCRLVNLSMWRCRRYTTQTYALYAESIGSTKHAAYIIHGTYVVQYHHQRQFLGITKLLHRQPLHFYRANLSHLDDKGTQNQSQHKENIFSFFYKNISYYHFHLFKYLSLRDISAVLTTCG